MINPKVKAFAFASLIVGAGYFLAFVIGTMGALLSFGHGIGGGSTQFQKVQDKTLIAIAKIMPFVSLLAGGFATGKIIKSKSWLYAVLFALIWILILFGGSAIGSFLHQLQGIRTVRNPNLDSRLISIIFVIFIFPVLGALLGEFVYRNKKTTI